MRVKFLGSLPRAFGAFGLALFLSACQSDTQEMIQTLDLSAAALNDYQGLYSIDKPNKAFAVSPSGAYAAAHTFPTPALAMATALLRCNERVVVGQYECYIYDLNGVIVASPPLDLKLKQLGE